MNVPFPLTITQATLLGANGATVAIQTLAAPVTLMPGDTLTMNWTISNFQTVPRAYDPSLDMLRPEGE